MSKVVCDICGTAYAETADQCPICGTAKSENACPVAEAETENQGHAYVKGGRFAQSNVRRQNSSKQETPAQEAPASPAGEEPEIMQDQKESAPMPQRKPRPAPAAKKPAKKSARQEPEHEQPSNLGLIIIVVVLLLGILSLGIFVAVRFINMNNARKEANSTTAPPSSSQLVPVPCTDLIVAGPVEYSVTDLAQRISLDIQCLPADTTDELNFDYNEDIIRVEKSGNQYVVTPLASGTTDIIISCGSQVTSVTIVCNIQNIPCNGISIEGPGSYTFVSASESETLRVILDPVSTTEEITWSYDNSVVSIEKVGEDWVMTPVADGDTMVRVSCGGYEASVNVSVKLVEQFVLEWACASDITLYGYGTKWRIYNGEVDVSKIQFVSSDESVATVENGYVYIWKNGQATITAAYGNQEITLIVRAKDVTVPENTTDPLYFLHTQFGPVIANDVSMKVGENLTFSLRDAEGMEITEGVAFSVTNDEIITVNENGRLTAVAAGTAYLVVEYEGVEYKCIIRVREVPTE